MTNAAPVPETSPAGGWLSGLVLGVASAFMLIELGVIGLTFLALAALLIAWKGPRLLAASGLVTGLGLIWTVLFTRVQITCGPGALFPESGCSSDDISRWILGSAGVFAVGLLLSAWALRRVIRRSRPSRPPQR
jgi:hypothetical protein